MKGKAILTLCDAGTGDVVKRVEEHNLVTNALQNIFSPPHYMLLHEFNYSKLFTGGLPLWKDLMAGIVLLGNSRAEDADDFMLDENTVPVGHAGSEYSGTNVLRGTLNANESGPIENGYRFTWDFGTDKANGTISCIGLTSKEFGNAGFQSGNESDGAFIVLPQAIGDTDSSPTGVFIHARGQYLGTFEPMVHLFAELNASGQLVFRRYKALDPSAIEINSDPQLLNYWEPISETVIKPTIDMRYDNRFFLNTDERVVYYFTIPARNSEGNMDFGLMGVSVDTLTVTRTKTFPLPYFNYDSCAVYNDYVYIMNTDGLCRYNMSGTLTKIHPCPYSSGADLFMYNGCLMQRAVGSVRCYSWGDDPCVINNEQLFMPLYSVDAKAPYVTAAKRASHSASATSASCKPVLYIVSSYLATINNLAQPLTKTSAQTLKITYEITN